MESLSTQMPVRQSISRITLIESVEALNEEFPECGRIVHYSAEIPLTTTQGHSIVQRCSLGYSRLNAQGKIDALGKSNYADVMERINEWLNEYREQGAACFVDISQAPSISPEDIIAPAVSRYSLQ